MNLKKNKLDPILAFHHPMKLPGHQDQERNYHLLSILSNLYRHIYRQFNLLIKISIILKFK